MQDGVVEDGGLLFGIFFKTFDEHRDPGERLQLDSVLPLENTVEVGVGCPHRRCCRFLLQPEMLEVGDHGVLSRGTLLVVDAGVEELEFLPGPDVGLPTLVLDLLEHLLV